MYFYHMFRQIAIPLFLFLAFICPTLLWAQSFSGNKDRFPTEYANWILSSKYLDAPKIANQWTSFYKNPNLAESEKYYQVALEIDPKHKDALEYYGELLLMKNDLQSAEILLKRLDTVCTLGCEQYRDLKKGINTYKSKRNP